jgi:site-specific recombinase XerD
MMTKKDFAYYLSAFLTKYLPGEKNLSTNTIAVYRDTFRLFLKYCGEMKGLPPNRIMLSSLTKELVIDFLDWLESERGCSVTTRNQRLSSLHGFIKFVQAESPDTLYELVRVLGIPPKKAPKTVVQYLTESDLKILFGQPDMRTRQGRRDLTLLVLMYDSAARVQEVSDLRVKDVRLSDPAVVTLQGKGRKTRQIPLLGKTKQLAGDYINIIEKLDWGIAFSDAPLFFNQRRQPLTRWGVSHILSKYVALAKGHADFTARFPVTPHILRHSKAMGMLKANVPLIYIRDFLGHVEISTTEVYARADNEMKRKSLEAAHVDLSPRDLPDWEQDANLMEWLNGLCRQ